MTSAMCDRMMTNSVYGPQNPFKDHEVADVLGQVFRYIICWSA